MTVLVATGLRREARIIEAASLSSSPRTRGSSILGFGGEQDSELDSRFRGNDGIRIIAGGGDAQRLEAELAIAAPNARMILSSGLAGALDPSLKVGDVVIDGDPALLARLQEALPAALAGRVVGQNRIAATAADKHALHAATGALAVDMESHVAARVAIRKRLPFGVIRVISDSATHDLPPAALVGMGADGGMALGPVLASLATRPDQLPALIRTGWNAERALRELGRVHDMLGRAGVFGLDLRQLTLDMG